MESYLERRRQMKQGVRPPDSPKTKKPLNRVSPKTGKAEPRKPLPKRSEKMKGVISALRPLYDRFLSTRPDCEIVSEVCTGQAECVHHVQGRGIKVILDDSKWRASCSACNNHVEQKDEEARVNGNKASRLSKK